MMHFTPTAAAGDPNTLHCPKCWKRRRHYARRQGELITYTCSHCGHQQIYIEPKPEG